MNAVYIKPGWLNGLSVSMMRFWIATSYLKRSPGPGAAWNKKEDNIEQHIVKLEQAMLGIDRLAAKKVVDHLYKDFSPHDITENLIVPVMERIGKGFEAGRVALSQVYMSGRFGEELIALLLPADSSFLKHRQDIAIAVIDDRHMLGKRIVCSFLRSGGLEIKDYGTIAATELVSRISADGIKILLISTLMLPSALRIKEAIRELKEINKDIKVVVGGAPFRLEKNLWQEVGADAVGKTAADALPILKQLTGDRL